MSSRSSLILVIRYPFLQFSLPSSHPSLLKALLLVFVLPLQQVRAPFLDQPNSVTSLAGGAAGGCVVVGVCKVISKLLDESKLFLEGTLSKLEVGAFTDDRHFVAEMCEQETIHKVLVCLRLGDFVLKLSAPSVGKPS